MRAFLSGQSGVALLNNGEEWFVIRLEPGDPLKTRFSSAVRLLDGSTDVREIRDVLPESVAPLLDVAHSKDLALQFVLVLLEARELGDLERRVLSRLERMLSLPEVWTHLLNRMYAAPLPQRNINRINRVNALLANDLVSSLFRTILNDQASIRKVRSVWETVSTGRFRSVQAREEFFLAAVDRGVVRTLATGGRESDTDHTIIAGSEILMAWATALATQTGGDASVDDEGHRSEPSTQTRQRIQNPEVPRTGSPQTTEAAFEIAPPLVERLAESPSALNPRFTFQSFVVGASNQFAYAAAQTVSRTPGRTYNPLFIYGGVGMGKSHLMHAINDALIKNFRSIRVIYSSSEPLMNELINCIRTDRMQQFRQRYREADVLLVDDVQVLAGKERMQEEFIHTFNELYDRQKQIVIASDSPPKDIPGLMERLRSRFELGLLADIQPPDLETKMAILEKKAEAEGIRLPDDVRTFVASKTKSNVRELEGALVKLIAYSSLTGTPINLQMARQVLRHLVHGQDRSVTIDSIQKAVAERFQIKQMQLKEKSTARKVAYPQEVAMYLVKELTDASLPEIGRAFGKVDDATVLKSIRHIEERRREVDAELDRAIRSIEESLM